MFSPQRRSRRALPVLRQRHAGFHAHHRDPAGAGRSGRRRLLPPSRAACGRRLRGDRAPSPSGRHRRDPSGLVPPPRSEYRGRRRSERRRRDHVRLRARLPPRRLDPATQIHKDCQGHAVQVEDPSPARTTSADAITRRLRRVSTPAFTDPRRRRPAHRSALRGELPRRRRVRRGARLAPAQARSLQSPGPRGDLRGRPEGHEAAAEVPGPAGRLRHRVAGPVPPELSAHPRTQPADDCRTRPGGPARRRQTHHRMRQHRPPQRRATARGQQATGPPRAATTA